MNEEELSDVIKKISGMIGSNNSENSNDSTYSNNTNSNSSNTTGYDSSENSNNFNGFNNSDNSNSSGNNFNIDFETLLKIKTMMDKMNRHQDNTRSNLLLSLKPYLRDSRKDKVDQYIKLLNMGDMLELFMNSNNDGGENK